MMLKLLRHAEFKKALLIGISIAVIYSFVLIPLGWFDVVKLKAKDLFFNIARQIKPAPKELHHIVFIAIDDESFKFMNRKWPWSRDILARMLDAVNDYDPLVVCFDFLLLGASADSEHDILLSRSIKNAGNILLPSFYGKKGEDMHAYQLFLESALGSGIINIPKDKDSFIRSTRAVILTAEHEALEYSIGIKAACRYFGIPFENISYDKEKIILKRPLGAAWPSSDILIPVRKNGTRPLIYAVNSNELKVIPLSKVFSKEAPKEALENKIVLIGHTSELFHDVHNTPVGAISGTEIIASDILMSMSGISVKELGWPFELLILLLFAVMVTITTYCFSTYKGLLSAFFWIAIFAGASIIVSLHNWWWDFFSAAFMVVVIYVAISFYKYIRLLIESIALKTLAITDQLTGLFTYRYLQIRLQNELDRATRYGNALSLVIVDIDHFKKLNDTYGHQKGNDVLKKVATIIKDCCRKADLTFRFGGEEFCVVLPQIIQSGAVIFAERLRKTIEDAEFPMGTNAPLKLTVSIGIAFLAPDIKSPNDLFERADKALYMAKKTGRNRVCEFQNQVSDHP